MKTRVVKLPQSSYWSYLCIRSVWTCYIISFILKEKQNSHKLYNILELTNEWRIQTWTFQVGVRVWMNGYRVEWVSGAEIHPWILNGYTVERVSEAEPSPVEIELIHCCGKWDSHWRTEVWWWSGTTPWCEWMPGADSLIWMPPICL